MDLDKIKNITPTAMSCFVTPCTYKNPFLPPFIPKLSSKENKRILVEFKYHNLCILFFLYLITFNLYSASIIFYRGLLLRKIMWLPDLIYRPLKEIIYRISLKL